MAINSEEYYKLGLNAGSRLGGLTKGLQTNQENNAKRGLYEAQMNNQLAIANQKIGAQAALEGMKQEQLSKRTADNNTSRENTAQLKAKTYADEQKKNRDSADARASKKQSLQEEKTKTQQGVTERNRIDNVVDTLQKNSDLNKQVSDHAKKKFGISGWGKKPSLDQMIEAYDELTGKAAAPLGGGLSSAGGGGNDPFASFRTQVPKGEILVLDLASKQMGSIPPSEFDPKKYQKV